MTARACRLLGGGCVWWGAHFFAGCCAWWVGACVGWVSVRGEHAVGFTLSTVRATGWWCVVVGGLTGVPGCSGCGGVGGLVVNCVVVVSIFLFCGFV